MPITWQGSISETIAALVREGKSQEQASAIAYGMARERGVSKSLVGKTLVARGERRLVTAIASVVSKGDGSSIVDAQDDVIEIDDLEDAFVESFYEGGVKKGGEMHERAGVADVVQNFTFSKVEWKALGEACGVDLSAMPELGLVKFRVTDDAVWRRVKAGELPEVSIAGTAQREAA